MSELVLIKSLEEYKGFLMNNKKYIRDILNNPIQYQFICDCRNIDINSIKKMIMEDACRLSETTNYLEKSDLTKKITMLLLSTISELDIKKFYTK